MTVYLLAGGGTAGHVNPLLAVADALRERNGDAKVLVLGTADGLEARLVPERGYQLLTVEKVPFPRRLGKAALSFPKRFRGAIKQTQAYIREHGVEVVAGFGGYASAPAYVAARREKIPFVVHEANARPGLANHLGARNASAVGVTFEGTPIRGAELVGMPLRTEILTLDRASKRKEAAKFFGLDANKPVLLVFGGSQGSVRLNTTLADSWRDILGAGWQVLHATGERNEVIEQVDAGYRVLHYIDRMDLALALADLVLSRAGSSTVSELTALGIPAIYVPLPIGNGEQALNAAWAVSAGAARLIPDAELNAELVRNQIVPLLQDAAKLQSMADAAHEIGIRTGTENVVAQLDRVLKAKS